MGEDQKRALLAVVLSGVVLFGWQYFFAPKQDLSKVTSNPQSSQITKPVVEAELRSDSMDTNNSDFTPSEVSTFELKNDKVSYEFNNYLVLQEASNKNTSFSFDSLFQSEKKSLSIEFNIDGDYKTIPFKITKISLDRVKVANPEMGVEGNLFVDEKGYLNFSLVSSNQFNYRIVFFEKPKKLENGQIKQYSFYSDDLTTFEVDSDEEGDSKIKWVGVDFNYHLLAIVFPEKSNYLFKGNESGRLSLRKSDISKSLEFKLLFTKKEYDTLASYGNNLQQSVDFGIWSIIAVPILRGLQFFYDIFPNYGISIILLTLIIRTLTFPLQYKSFKSMKKMQVIQPELTKIREKFKDDPQRMQQETMSLFKQAGANPLGGCLPLLLQMPLFFAFYKVLYSSVELVQAPFYFWIKDLSEKDPYYVLPILMAGAMFLSQKLTPMTTTDPVQKKVLMFMPLMFAVFMKDLPAGLTLYIFVSTIMGIGQQLFVYKRT